MPKTLNAWGEPVRKDDPSDMGWVPEEERLDSDEDHDTDSAPGTPRQIEQAWIGFPQ